MWLFDTLPASRRLASSRAWACIHHYRERLTTNIVIIYLFLAALRALPPYTIPSMVANKQHPRAYPFRQFDHITVAAKIPIRLVLAWDHAVRLLERPPATKSIGGANVFETNIGIGYHPWRSGLYYWDGLSLPFLIVRLGRSE